jgi:hypothetical protein
LIGILGYAPSLRSSLRRSEELCLELSELVLGKMVTESLSQIRELLTRKPAAKISTCGCVSARYSRLPLGAALRSRCPQCSRCQTAMPLRRLRILGRLVCACSR